MTSQLGLFDRSSVPSMDRTFRDARRIALDETSWVEHVPGWLSGSDALFDELAAIPGWEQRERWMFTQSVEEPRLTAEYRELADAPSELLREVGRALSARYGVPYDRAWLNLYRDHRDSTGWHGDRGLAEQCIVPVLSLGETRRFQLRRASGGPSTTLTVRAGDLVTMGGRCQRDWVHAVPKESKRAGARISVNFSSGTQRLGDRE